MKQNSEREINDKNILKNLAEKAKKEIDLNNNLNKIKDVYSNYINEIKMILFDKGKLEENLRNLNISIKSNIEKIKQEYQKLKLNKYDIYYQKCTDELDMERPMLNQMKADEFILKNSLIEKEYLINKLKSNLWNSKIYIIFREPKREAFLDNKIGNTNIKDINEKQQINLLKIARKLNSLVMKSKKKEQKINKLKNEIKQLNEIIYLAKSEKKINQLNITLNSETKTLDNTPSINREINLKEHKISETKSFPSNNNKILFLQNSKKYEKDDLAEEMKNDYKFNLSNNITKAIINTQIPKTFTKLKSISVNPMLIEDLESNKKDNNIIINEDTNYSTEKKCFDLENKKALSAENRAIKKIKKSQKKNKIIQTFLNLEELFESSDSENDKDNEGILIESVIHSDDETTLEEKVKPKASLSKTYNEKILKQIPSINLSLIEFNKLKVYQEIDLYSLQRRNYKGQNIEDNIKAMKKKYKKIKFKERLNHKKEKAMKKFINDLKSKYILYKKIRTKSSALNSKVKYISNNEILDLNTFEKEDESDLDVGSDYLNEDDEISEDNN